MYTNIPIQEGLDAFGEELDNREDKTIPTHYYIKLLDWFLNQTSLNLIESIIFNCLELLWEHEWLLPMQIYLWQN